MERLEAALQAVGIASMRLRTSHAFHSPMMEGAVEPLVRAIRNVPRSQPRIPYISNLTGTWLQDGEATDPAYWGAHLRHTVRFADGVATLLAEHSPLCIEVGPGRSLSRLVRRHPRWRPATVAVSSLPSQADAGSEAETVLGALGELWVAGAAVDWRTVSAGERRRRIPMPPYPFERQRFVAPRRGTTGNGAAPPAIGAGVRSGSSPAGRGVGDWLYTPTWTRSLLPGSPAPAHGPWLVLADQRGVGDALARGLTERGHDVVMVRRLDPAAASAERPRAGDSDDLAIDPRDAGAFGRILGLLEERGGAPAHIVHLWSIDDPATDGPCQDFDAYAFRTAQEGGLSSVLALARAVVGARVAPRITLITDQAHDVTGDEALRPECATLLGIRHVLPQEHPGLRCFGVDVVAPAPGAAPDRRLVDQLVAELEAAASDPVVAYRGGYRWRADVERFTAASGTETLLRARGVYVVTGGLGRIGRKLATHLARRWQASVVLVGRHVPEGADRAALVAEIERLGGQVLLSEGDAGDPGHLRAIARLAEERFGPVNGVIHAAGATGAAGFGPALSTGEARCQAHFHPKVDGVLAIDEVFGRRGLDFVLLFSSLSTVLGGLGFGAYAAANAVLDTYASLRDRAGPTTWLSVAWAGWSLGPAPDGRPGQPTIDPDEGMEAFDLLCRGRPPARVIVAAGSLPERIANWISAPAEAGTRPEPGGGAPEVPGAGPSPGPGGGHARPDLEASYVPPRTELERGVAAVWEQLFGIEGIGILDDFFELGGHSLLAIQLIARLRDTFGVDLPVKELFDDPTVAGLAGSIGVLQRDRQDPAMRLAAALELVEGLSESEVAALLDDSPEASPPSVRPAGRSRLAAGDASPASPPAIGPAPRGTEETSNDAVRRFYDAVNARLDVIEAGRYSMFLNFGYADDGTPGSTAARLPAHLFNRNSVRLVLETVGGTDLAGTQVLDVGCGRGGTLDTLRTYCDPHTLVGLDLSAAAIAFCCRTHRDPSLRFLVADAARLPFAEGSFDAVTNIESSHTYPDIDRFCAEVHRVLSPGGILLYADLVPAERLPQRLRSLSEAGLRLEGSRDITRNVLAACDKTAVQRLAAFGTGNDARTMDNFLAVPGSKVYEDMASGRSIYGIWRARKP
jgi:SAM-dependent methyltransferase/NAD(P)-dependent dehydrogenase (short-subunit alcohol dehydrogenase family)/acyl carrier protein